MECPGCRNEMSRLTFDAVLASRVDVDVCSGCRAFWFDPYESLQLTPASTLELFRLIADAARAGGSSPFPGLSRCPKCGGRLVFTHDRQRNTPFHYYRCEEEHGRFLSFTDFLKEKSFVQPLSPQQIADLRRKVRTINCSNCGAPVDLVKDSACAHCGSPLIMLDLDKMAEVADRYQRAAARPRSPLAPPPPSLDMSRPLSGSLIDAGLEAVADWLFHLLT